MASSGTEAIEYLKNKIFDLVITDFNMPRMDGANLLFWCRMNDYHQPFIFITSKVENIPLEELVLKDCCTSVLNKPFAIEQLLAEIEKARGRHHSFDCFGIKLPLNKGDYRNSFPGQHYLSSNG
jgi:CheY-like chemotaxis protein